MKLVRLQLVKSLCSSLVEQEENVIFAGFEYFNPQKINSLQGCIHEKSGIHYTVVHAENECCTVYGDVTDVINSLGCEQVYGPAYYFDEESENEDENKQ